MRKLIPFALVAFAAAGCVQPLPETTPHVRLLEPKRQMILTYRCEVRAAMPQKPGQTSVDWAELELPMAVTCPCNRTDEERHGQHHELGACLCDGQGQGHAEHDRQQAPKDELIPG